MKPRPLFAVELSGAAKQIDVKRLTKQEGPAWAALSAQSAGWRRQGPGLGQGLPPANLVLSQHWMGT